MNEHIKALPFLLNFQSPFLTNLQKKIYEIGAFIDLVLKKLKLRPRKDYYFSMNIQLMSVSMYWFQDDLKT